MPQSLKPEDLDAALGSTRLSEESIPTLEAATHYFALVPHKGRNLLCIFGDDAQWRTATYQEMMELM